MVDIPERTATADVSANVGVVASSTREGYTESSILLGYDSVYHDRTAFASVDQSVGVGAISTREGYSESSILLGYDSTYHDRTGYCSVDQNIAIPLPVARELPQAQQGWGTPVRARYIIRLVAQASDAGMDVAEVVTVQSTPLGTSHRDAVATVSENDVVVPQGL